MTIKEIKIFAKYLTGKDIEIYSPSPGIVVTNWDVFNYRLLDDKKCVMSDKKASLHSEKDLKDNLYEIIYNLKS